MIAPITKHPGPKRIKTLFVQLPDREWLWHNYIELDRTIRDMAQETGCSTTPIAEWLRAEGIKKSRESLNKRHSRRMSGAGNPAWVGGTTAKYWKKVALKRFPECQWCGSKDRLELHHVDHDTSNNDPSNHMILCKPCNRIEAYMWRLQNDGRAEIVFDRTNRRITIQFR